MNPLLSPSSVAGLLYLAAFLAAGYFLHRRGRLSRRKAALAELQSVDLPSTDERLRLLGSTATIVKLEESDSRQMGYSLTLYLRNEAGEYFLFISAKPKAYVKHISHENARVILKHLYVPPPAAGADRQST